MQNDRLSLFTFGLFALFILYLLWLMAQPFVSAIIFACILAGTFQPLVEFIEEKSQIKRQVSAIIICLIITLMIFVPFIFLIFQISGQTLYLYQKLNLTLEDTSVQDFLFGSGFVARIIQEFSSFFNIDLNMLTLKQQLSSHLSSLASNLIGFINGRMTNLLSFFFQFVVMIVIIYALFREGHELKAFIYKLLPIPRKQVDLVVSKFNQMNFATLTCNSLSGFVQGTMAGIGFYIAGLHSFLLWTFLCIFLAFIPIIGMTVIYIPVCAYLFIKGSTISAIILFIYCATISILMDNVFKPRFIGKRIKMNSFFILFCIVGGITAFGMGGLFYGPIVGILFLTLTDIYHEYYHIS